MESAWAGALGTVSGLPHTYTHMHARAHNPTHMAATMSAARWRDVG